MRKKNELKQKEILFGIPSLQQYFQNQEYQIKKFENDEKYKQHAEKRKDKREKLWKTAKNLCAQDLEIIYYINNIAKLAPYRILHKLRELNKKVEEWDKLLKGEEIEK